jgi:membrane protease YdiL (CAAX protease family)
MLVLLVGFAPSTAASVYKLFHPQPVTYTNARIAGGFFYELLTLAVFGILFTRQRRRIPSLGLYFRWTDLPKGLGLYVGTSLVTSLAYYVLYYCWILLTGRTPAIVETKAMFAGTSILLLLPFLLVNPFFEEILVRGYLMTEIIELRSSVVLAATLSLALQTSYHLYYGLYGALVVGSGLSILAIYYAKSRRLIPVIVAHLLWDLTALLTAWHR